MKSFSIIFFLSLSLNVICQDTVITKVIVFDEDNMSDFTSESNKPYRKNAIKFNPLLIVNGEIPIYYERTLTNSLSIEAALGITFKDYLGSISSLISDDGDGYYADSKSEKVKSNISFKLGARYYTGGVALDGFYFALEYANRKYSTEVTLTSYQYGSTIGNSIQKVETFNIEKAYNEFKLIAGNQEHSYWDNFFIDYYFGVGINKKEIKDISYDLDTSNNYVYKIQKTNKTSPSIYAGLKLGFEF